MRISATDARSYIRHAFLEIGLSGDDAGVAAAALVSTSLWGIDSHGIRLFPTYVKEVLGGRANCRATMQQQRTGPACAQIDAQGQLGILAGYRAADLAREIAHESGSAVVSVHNSNHFGAAQLYARALAEQDLLAIVMTNAAPRVVPAGGIEQMFGTNPICFAAPSENDVFCLDMATSQVSYSRVKALMARGEKLPDGCAIDRRGQPCTDVADFGGLLPLGGYKGQGLAMMVEILCSLLAGRTSGLEMSHLDRPPYDTGRDVSHLVIAIDPVRFAGLAPFKAGLHAYIDTIRRCAPAGKDPVIVAGDKEQQSAVLLEREGIPMGSAEIASFVEVEQMFSPASPIASLVRGAEAVACA